MGATRRGRMVAARDWVGPSFGTLLVLLAIWLPLVVDQQNIWNLLFLIALQISLAQSWNMLAGFAGQTSLGHAAFFGIGALVARTLWLQDVAMPASMLAGGLAAALFSMLIGVPTFRLRGAYFAIGTLGMAEVLRITVSQNRPLISTMSGALIGSYDLATRYYAALALAVGTTVVAYALLRSRLSLGMLAVREDEEAAGATGVDVLLHKLIALLISSLFAGFAGALFAYQQISYYPSAPFSPVWTFDAILITFLGGLGTVSGPVAGAIVFVVLRDQLSVRLVDVHQIIFGIVFIGIVLVFPGGLVEIWARLRRRFSMRRRAAGP